MLDLVGLLRVVVNPSQIQIWQCRMSIAFRISPRIIAKSDPISISTPISINLEVKASKWSGMILLILTSSPLRLP